MGVSDEKGTRGAGAVGGAVSSVARSASAPVLLVVAIVLAALAGAVGLGLEEAALAAAGLVVATGLAGAFAVYLIVSERRRHESAEGSLQAQASFLESLVDAIAAISSSRDVDEIAQRTCEEAKRIFNARSARLIQDEVASHAQLGRGSMVVPLKVRGEPIGAVELTRPVAFHRADLMRATVLADFAARAVENARLLDDARERETERARLTERLITAEQDERRRLSLHLHDGPLQSMSGIALMHDAALAAIEDGRYEDAAKVIESSLERERDTIRSLRDLTFAIEPLVLRDHGFGAAVRALGDQVEGTHRITVSADVEAGERLGEKTQVALYQVIREALNQAVLRKPGAVQVTATELEDGGLAVEITDDGVLERRRASLEALEERVGVVNARLSIEHGEERGTVVRVLLPAYVAAPGG